MRAARGESGEAVRSASGLRPGTLFVSIAVVLFAVGGKAAHIALWKGGEQPRAIKEDCALWPAFEIRDRAGKNLAVPVECFDLSLSPQSMWRAHTPGRIAARLGPTLGLSAGETLARLLPVEAEDGVLTVAAPKLLDFDLPTAQRVALWLKGVLELPAEHANLQLAAIHGMWLVPGPTAERATLAWRPAELLGEEERARHMGETATEHPEFWVQKLLSGLALFVAAERFPVPPETGPTEAGRSSANEPLREAIWAELLPSQYRVVERWIQPSAAMALAEILREECVSPWQMQLEPALARAHPVRPGAQRGGPADSFAILGHWGVLSPPEALERARMESGLRGAEPYLNARQEAFVRARADALWTARHPLSGLELLAASELARDRWAFLADDVRTYVRRLRYLPRDRRREWDGAVPNYFLAASDASPAPRVVSTLDAELQVFMHNELLRLLTGLEPALVMGLAIDVQSGDVLAVDSLALYPTGGFAPIRHQFTPGSTFKAVIMALALDLGLVQPDEAFATHAPAGIVITDERGGKRLIREAEGAPTEAWISASEGIAQSVNAVLVQIGLRVDPPLLRARLAELGYGRAPDVGLGPECSGYLAPLEKGTWRYRFTHASVSFGHEISVSLWQHASALASLLRGGIQRPLRLVQAVEQGERRWELELEQGARVLSERAASELRAMLARGAATGTGMRVAGPEACPEFYQAGGYIGTKTGTTEKVETELCLHIELAHNAEVHPNGEPCPTSCRASLRGRRDHRSRRATCYTSSMLAIGRLPGEEREVLVLVVVEDARSKLKFGADVAGPTTVAILRQALGLEPRPKAPTAEEPGLALEDTLPEAWFNDLDSPWAEVEGAGDESR